MMLKVSVLMLLAMALAATTAHARLYLFGQLLTSSNQPHHNQDGSQLQVEQQKATTKVQPLGAIPYPECIKTCDTCFCTLIYPPELSMCICGDSVKSSSPKVTGQNSNKVNAKRAHVRVVQEKSITEVESLDAIPYPECMKTCDTCLCTLIYPPELSMCICGDSVKSSSPKVTGQNSNQVDAQRPKVQVIEEEKAITKVQSLGAIPYPECIKICGTCFCTPIYPPEQSMCICGDSVKSSTTKAEGRALSM
ncbi:uncharacterized protein LOC126799352 [Argentina anserina]|uniref:uncharacterized protein LOC126799352 n=1 Tax=Argentina anserina TaxID=57926 RepID=UPI0021761EBF|nr:uncharacterized protein LOC126799352 [Potentilla anserina]